MIILTNSQVKFIILTFLSVLVFIAVIFVSSKVINSTSKQLNYVITLNFFCVVACSFSENTFVKK